MAAVDISAPGDDMGDNESIVTEYPQAASASAPFRASPDNEAAEAMAEVAAMEGPSRRAHRAGEEAVMGAAANGDGVEGFEVRDESGELVMQRFLQFLGD